MYIFNHKAFEYLIVVMAESAALEFDILDMKIKDICIYDLVMQSHIILSHKL